MGLPLIGESLQLIIPSYSLDLHPFFKKRAQSVMGRSVVISIDSEFNYHIVKQEGKLVELWYLDSFSKLFTMEGENRIYAAGVIHKYTRSLLLDHFGAESLKGKLVPQIEVFVSKTLETWSTNSSIEMKQAASIVSYNFRSRHLINVAGSFMSYPLNIPSFAYNKSLQDKKEAMTIFKKIVKEKMNSPE
ncbi:cytochrome p450 85a3 [Quercus suber]|uniref:Cytochrome p450 85a3 n=1 Tax=Quercus suber TaxID=58331 RepID=A0AAW0LR13_QUESU